MQLKKDIEQLYKIQQRLMSFCVTHDMNSACMNVAYSGLQQAIEGLEKLEDIVERAEE